MDAPILLIRMQSPGYESDMPCPGCGGRASPFHGLPVFNGDIMSNDWPGEWGGAPACEACFEKHLRGELPTADRLYRHLLFELGHLDGSGI